MNEWVKEKLEIGNWKDGNKKKRKMIMEKI